jgi:ankyrin repeat protein
MLLEQQNKKRLLMARQEQDRTSSKVITELLLERSNAEIDSKDKSGRTPLSWAMEKGWENVVKLLLETGKVDVDSKDNSGRTPLSWAMSGIQLLQAGEKGCGAVVKLLSREERAETIII